MKVKKPCKTIQVYGPMVRVSNENLEQLRKIFSVPDKTRNTMVVSMALHSLIELKTKGANAGAAE